MKLTIPSTFELAGRTWTVKRVGKKKWYGRTRGGNCLIELSTKSKDDEELMHTFLHELLHAILYTQGDDKLFYDEFFVDSSASLLMQALTTAK